MFLNRVERDLSHDPIKLGDAETIAENTLRNLIKKYISELFTPKKSDWSINIVRYINDIGSMIEEAKKGNINETEKYADKIEKFSKDPNYWKRELIENSHHIIDNLLIDKLIPYFESCKINGLEYANYIWINEVKKIPRYKPLYKPNYKPLNDFDKNDDKINK